MKKKILAQTLLLTALPIPRAGEKIANVTLLDSDAKLDWKQNADALVIQQVTKWPTQHAVAFKITPEKSP